MTAMLRHLSLVSGMMSFVSYDRHRDD